MSARSLESFLSRVGVFLVLVVAYLLALQGLHVVDQLRAHHRLEDATEKRARILAEAIVQQIGRDRLLQSLHLWRQRGIAPSRPDVPRAFLQEHGVTTVELLAPGGWEMDAAVRTAPDVGPSARDALDEAARRRLAAGESHVDLGGGMRQSPVYAVVTVYTPVLDPSARLAGILEVDMAAETLALSRRDLRWNLALQGGSLLAFIGLLLAFTRWIVRPVRLLDASTRSGDEEVAARLASQDETGFVIETYRKMIEQLQEKELELRRLRALERHRADELRELNASIVDSLVSGILLLDLSGRVRSVNEVFRSVLALPAGRLVGRHFKDVLPHAPELHAKLQACLDEGLVIRRDEVRLGLAGVGRRDLGLTLSPLRDPEGSRAGALCLVVDLTEFKRLQEQVRLKASLAELGELSAGVAHEFRNSLGTILGFAKLVERTAEGEAIEHAAAIREEVAALRRVVDDFLRFANPTRLVVEPVDLGAVLRDAAGDAASRAAAKGVTVTVPESLPTLTGDETLLRRVFGNLLRNAVDAVAQGGHVEVSAEHAEGEIVLHVDDDGPGIPAADRERVFVPFFTRKEQGTGLGLALARKVVVHHGGRIVADAAPLGGARFTVCLPLRGERDAAVP